MSPWHLDELLDRFPVPIDATTIAARSNGAAGQVERIVDRGLITTETVRQSERPLVLAGDCLASLAIVAGRQRRGREVSVIWLDAHGDFNTPASSTSGYLAGMSLAMLTGRAPEPIGGPIGLRPIPDGQVILVDARDLDPAERVLLDASDIGRVAADPRDVGAAAAGLSGSDVYLHIDVDIIDSRDVTGLRWDAGAGPSFSIVEACLAEIVAAVSPDAVCIACPWPAGRIAEATTRHAVSRVAAAIGSGLRWPGDQPGSA